MTYVIATDKGRRPIQWATYEEAEKDAKQLARKIAAGGSVNRPSSVGIFELRARVRIPDDLSLEVESVAEAG